MLNLSFQGKDTDLFRVDDKIACMIEKCKLWAKQLGKGSLASFSSFHNRNQATIKMEVDVPLVQANTEPTQPPKVGRSRAKRNRDAKKTNDFRQRKGDALVAAENQSIMKELGIGSSALFDALRDQASKQGVPIVVSSRGVGLAVHATQKHTRTFKRRPAAAEVPTRELYRTGLYLYDQKLALAHLEYGRLLDNASIDAPGDYNTALPNALATGFKFLSQFITIPSGAASKGGSSL